jgi:hypothetical protein
MDVPPVRTELYFLQSLDVSVYQLSEKVTLTIWLGIGDSASAGLELSLD